MFEMSHEPLVASELRAFRTRLATLCAAPLGNGARPSRRYQV